MIMHFDGNTTSLDTFSGSIGKSLGGQVSVWSVAHFKSIPNSNFPSLPNNVLDYLSSDQYYSYRICWATWAVILRHVDEDLELLET